MTTADAPARPTQTSSWTRALILAFVVLAFAHVAFGLGSKALWWDESLSLQRAESPLGPLLRGTLLIQDGVDRVDSTDQHPFFYFLLQGAILRLAGQSEYALRFVSALAATLLVPCLYVLGRLFARREIVPPQSALWAALFAAISPFFLWFGQEARPYALWATLAVLVTYMLLAACEPRPRAWAWRAGYLLVLAMFLLTHFYAVFLLPVQAFVVYRALARRSRGWALVMAGLMLAAGLALGAILYWTVVSQGGGGNFSTISLGVLIPDLFNAYSLGLSVNLDDVRWLDLIFAVTAIAGAAWMMRSRRSLRRDGWVVPVSVLVPILVILIANSYRPVYMTARHLSLIGGLYLLLLGSALGVLQKRSVWLAIPLATLMMGGAVYSTANYYTQDSYAKDDYRGFGDYVRARVMPGDAVLFLPPTSWRLFDYYGDMERVYAAEAKGVNLPVFGIPPLDANRDLKSWLDELGGKVRRIWVFKGHPFYANEEEALDALRERFVEVRDVTFFSHQSLHALLFLPKVPALEGMPAGIEQPVQIDFGGKVRLVGADADTSAWQAGIDDLPLPITLYWQVDSKPERKYKYILQLVSEKDGERTVLATAEHEPFETSIPTTWWDPGKTIIEPVELSTAPPAPGARLELAVQIYDAETQEKLPVRSASGAHVADDGFTAVFPFPAP